MINIKTKKRNRNKNYLSLKMFEIYIKTDKFVTNKQIAITN
jgi:hypothetical protein